MGSYRFELSNGRAGCQNKECKDNAVKIPKGELRVGSWVESEKFQSYQWRHWGCTTPKVIENIANAWEEIRSNENDYSVLDGYEDLPDALQLKIRTALTQGHVADDDWKGDVEVNRPGCTGFRQRAPRGKNVKAEATHDQQKPTVEDSDANDDTEPSEKPKTKPKKATVKAVAESSNDADASEKAKPKAKRAPRAKKAVVKEDSEASDHEAHEAEDQKPAANIKKSRAKNAATGAEPGTKRKTSGEETQDAESGKPKRGRTKPTKTDSAHDDTETAVPAKPKRGRKKVSSD
ncbi:PARP-type zinc finger-containing protein C2A9.07c [Penicillium maclennaniae]|uniref:PARP-type zinc finger-containing protein C2A9.07c n=1 Tax=Penicillium maclennaniae TaxID=1343394 RepID=UPI00253F783A|nr:PARP-type zinc finger-containing protein C2A9.07c [Penicillium maclennaniae]KAJ5684057.1 PARP-type zinc finger-containing protein C2A9.07c [Penicillium maclennaniae]